MSEQKNTNQVLSALYNLIGHRINEVEHDVKYIQELIGVDPRPRVIAELFEETGNDEDFKVIMVGDGLEFTLLTMDDQYLDIDTLDPYRVSALKHAIALEYYKKGGLGSRYYGRFMQVTYSPAPAEEETEEQPQQDHEDEQGEQVAQDQPRVDHEDEQGEEPVQDQLQQTHEDERGQEAHDDPR